jgi:(S)-2-hydroxyglutarate dehydrogenase
VEKNVDFLIVGCGILGLSIGLEILRNFPASRTLILDKESSSGSHASGRNSGVLHAGFYYSADSLKAKFCADGNLELRKVIRDHNIPLLECGKVVVAQNESELAQLIKLHERGNQNGVKQEILPASDLSNFEPYARTHKEFLWSPNTAVSDPKAVIQALELDFLTKGGEILHNAKFTTSAQFEHRVNGEPIRAGKIVNVSGTGAIDIANRLGEGLEYAQLPVLGLYKITDDRTVPLKTLVYPVPNPEYPFLGVHFTLTLDKKIKIGPTAIPIIGSEQYSMTTRVSKGDLISSTKAIKSLVFNSPKLLASLAVAELPKVSTRRLVTDGQRLVPNAKLISSWKYKEPGIRAQLVKLEDGKFEMDFVVRSSNGVVHVLNAVSPGWTAAIPFANYIFENYLATSTIK